MIEAKIIADSIGPFGDRIITYVLTFPRIVLAEFNTHRALSRNSASSRAIPFRKMVQMVQENPFIPIKWMKDHTGMQGTEYFEGNETERLKINWLQARDYALDSAIHLNSLGLTKQICNRILEPYMWHTCIATGTEWENFFALRAHPDAEIHIQDLAFKMLEAANASTSKQLKEGEWHIPFGDYFETNRVKKLFPMKLAHERTMKAMYQEAMLKIATARCARVSYLNFEGKDDYEADIALYDRLLASGHMSPFEHCAQVMSEEAYYNHISGIPYYNEGYPVFKEESYGWCGNFRGFIQLRKTLENENKKDERYNRK